MSYEFSILNISVHVRRKSGFWFNNCLMPSWIITSSLLSSYGQSVGDGSRLEVSVTVLLTLTTFKFLVAHKLPDVDYMTLMCAPLSSSPAPTPHSSPAPPASSAYIFPCIDRLLTDLGPSLAGLSLARPLRARAATGMSSSPSSLRLASSARKRAQSWASMTRQRVVSCGPTAPQYWVTSRSLCRRPSSTVEAYG